MGREGEKRYKKVVIEWELNWKKELQKRTEQKLEEKNYGILF